MAALFFQTPRSKLSLATRRRSGSGSAACQLQQEMVSTFDTQTVSRLRMRAGCLHRTSSCTAGGAAVCWFSSTTFRHNVFVCFDTNLVMERLPESENIQERKALPPLMERLKSCRREMSKVFEIPRHVVELIESSN